MTWIVVSESLRVVQVAESYATTPGPSIPGGVMHGKSPRAMSTLCDLEVADALHVWPALSFPRRYGRHCESCLDATAELMDLDAAKIPTEATP